jgi:endonuclease YncB( thermonuclease family)
MKGRALAFALFLAIMLAATQVLAQRATMFGNVVDVVDGKTVVIEAASGRINAELQFIDVPPAGEPMNGVVTEHLRKLVVGKSAEYRIRNILKDHSIGRLTVAGNDVSQQMLRDGAAWHVPANISGQDTADFQVYASTEAAAKNEKRGVWAFPDLKPSWERSSDTAADSDSAAWGQKPSSYWGDKNPRLGSLGALVNGYNADTKTGFVGLPVVPVAGTPEELGAEIRLYLGITFYYRETAKGRKGLFVIRLLSDSRKLQFLTHNDLVIYGGGKTLNLGKPRRTTSPGLDGTREELTYRISKEAIQRVVDYENVLLKVGGHYIHAHGARYLLLNLLQVAE